MKLSYLIIVLCCCATIQLQAQAQALVIDKIVTKVGGEVILYSEVEEQYAYLNTQMMTEDVDRCEILKNMIAQKLLINQAKLDSIEVTDEIVNKQLDARINRILQLMNNDMERFEAYYGRTVEEIKSKMKDDIRDQLLGENMRRQITANVEATPKETVKFFHNIPTDSIPYYNSVVELNELVFKPIISEEEEQKSIDKLKDLRKRILEGEMTFSEAASLYSEDLASARNGGSLGMMERGTLVQEYEAAAYNLEKGQISEVVKTQYGYHLIKLIKRRGNNILTKHILIIPELTEADLQRSIEKLDTIKYLIESDSISFELAVRKYGDKNVRSYFNGGGMLNPQSGDSFFEVGQLDPDIYFAIDTIDVGEIAGPIKYRQRDGSIMLKLVQLESMTPPHKASLETDYARIKELASRNKEYEVYKDWIESHIKTTFIKIYPPFNTCSDLMEWVNGNSVGFNEGF